MDFKRAVACIKSIPPLPKTCRGYGIHVDGTSVGEKRIIYTNGNFVIIRNLSNQFNSVVFAGHKCTVEVAKFSPNGLWVASGDSKGNVLVWCAKTFKRKNEVRVNSGVLDISWGSDNSQIIAVGKGGNGKYAKIFKIDSTNNIGNIFYHTKSILSCALRPKKPFGAFTASEDLTINFYQNLPYKYIEKHRVHTKYPNCVRFDPSGDICASVGGDSLINLFSGEGKFLRSNKNCKNGHSGSIYSCSFSPDGKLLLTAGGDKTARIWDIENLECVKIYKLGISISDMQVSSLWIEGCALTVSLDGSINFLDLDGDNTEKVWRGHQSIAESILVDEQNKRMFSSGSKGDIIMWNLEKDESYSFNGKGHGSSPINFLAFGKDHNEILSVGFDNNLCVSYVDSMKTELKMNLHGQPKGLCSNNAEEHIVAIVTSKNLLYLLYSGENDEPIKLDHSSNCISVSPSNSLCAIGSNEGLYIYDMKNDFKQIKNIKKHTSNVVFTSFSENGKYLLSVGSDLKTYLWDISNDFTEPVNSRGWKFHCSVVTSACFSKDNKKVYTASRDESIIVWDNIENGNRAKK